MVRLRFKDRAANRTNWQAINQSPSGRAKNMEHIDLRGGAEMLGRLWSDATRCGGTTSRPATLPQSARCQEPWHLSIQTVALPLRFGRRMPARLKTTCCPVGAYPILATAHDFCYPLLNP